MATKKVFSEKLKVTQICERCDSTKGLFYQIKGEWVILCKKCHDYPKGPECGEPLDIYPEGWLYGYCYKCQAPKINYCSQMSQVKGAK